MDGRHIRRVCMIGDGDEMIALELIQLGRVIGHWRMN
jgi:hypothetical protein